HFLAYYIVYPTTSYNTFPLSLHDALPICDGHLFQVVLQTYYDDELRKRKVLGSVVMGRELDSRGASELGRISSSQLIFRSGSHIDRKSTRLNSSHGSISYAVFCLTELRAQ